MSDAKSFPYETRLNILYPALEVGERESHSRMPASSSGTTRRSAR